MLDLNAADEGLVEAAREALRVRFRDDWHHVAAAVRTDTGNTYSSVNLDANVGRVAICAESVAIGMARTAEPEAAIVACAAVFANDPSEGEIAVVSPCGACRELLSDVAPEAHVIVPDVDGAVRKTTVADLLPAHMPTTEENR